MDCGIINCETGLHVFGENMPGVLGVSRVYEYANVPTKVSFFDNMHILGITCNSNHVIVYCKDGLYGWGSNYYGQLGFGVARDELRSYRVIGMTEVSKPAKIGFFEGKRILNVVCGYMFTIVNCDDGLYVFGINYSGQLGCESDILHSPTKLDFFDDKKILNIICGRTHSFIHCENGLYGFGSNSYGQLAINSYKEKIPTKVTFFNYKHVLNISCGSFHTIVHCTEGLYAFGSNNHGQLGLYHNDDIKVPTIIDFFRHKHISNISCGDLHNIITCDEGLYSFGRNDSGQLGLGGFNRKNSPKKIFFFGKKKKILNIFCGYSNSFVNCEDGLYAFGSNHRGQLGLGHYENINIPTKITFFDMHPIINKKSGSNTKGAHN